MRFIGVDYGKKSVGLSISDEEGKMAFPYKTLSNNKDLVKNIADICKSKNVEGLVLGKSQTFSGEDNPIMKDIEVFRRRFLKAMSIPVYMEPEFFSTEEASFFQGRNKNIDASASTIILQRFLEKNNFKGM